MALTALRARLAPMNERSLRRAATAKGVVIAKSMRRDPQARGYGLWSVRDLRSGVGVGGSVDDEGFPTFTYEQVQALVMAPGRRVLAPEHGRRRNGQFKVKAKL